MANENGEKLPSDVGEPFCLSLAVDGLPESSDKKNSESVNWNEIIASISFSNIITSSSIPNAAPLCSRFKSNDY